MLAVVAGHAMASFMVTPIGWAVQDRSRFLGCDLAAWIIRQASMPAFFWLAGYGARALYDARGAGGFARDRFLRILVPLAILLVPNSLALDFLWDWGREVGARGVVADNIPKLEGSELEILLGHLWFLYYLVWMSLGALVLAPLARRFPARMPVVVVPAVLACGVLAYLRAVHTDTPLGFIPNLPILGFMGAFFAWGWLVGARPDELERYTRGAGQAAAIAVASLGVVIATLARGLDDPSPPPIYASVASGVFSIAAVAALLGACARFLGDRPRPLLRAASRASYTAYVVHLPVAVVFQISLANAVIPGPLKYLAILTATATVCAATYAMLATTTRRSRT